MALIPTPGFTSIGQAVTVTPASAETSRTYKMDLEKKRVVGFTDGQEAMQQVILKILLTQRFAFRIYSWNYGTEINALVGKSYPVFESEVRRVIREALLADSRITDLTNFSVEPINKRTASVRFTAETIFGPVPVEQEVGMDV